MSNNIKCPHCGKLVEITTALKHQIEEKVLTDINSKHQQEIESIIQKTEEKVKKQLAEKRTLEITDLKKELEEKNQKVDELRKQELKLREEKRRIEEKEKDLELETQRKIDQEKKNIEEKILKQEQEKYRHQEQEKEKIIEDLKKSLEEAQRKAQIGSQQLQGEVLELDLEETLRSAFLNDLIEPIGKGVKGADIRQVVKSPAKKYVCGTILWETKRTKAWTDKWITKLKNDLRAEKANIPVIVTSIMPKEMKTNMGLKNGVWITDFNLVIPLAFLLRKNLLEVTREKVTAKYKDKKADILYQYITGHEFKQQLEAIVEVYLEMQIQITKEKTAFEKIWKARQGQIERLFTSTAGVAGSIEGKTGLTSFQIKGLDLLDSGDE
ncbi:hypothetical protein COT75_03925 [Candidatus Beckwithbacteria bacterium CG10_big_fil_rev_8_21_14_0_10_34_10]|uniref:DUF2130 domain-containing protein n=1 Tax=Candidatus Beckwithbacteria bacterium CG10_big_fil_rev_8_21_14_0_10_34_10 TaxID=1974495 RepID=A0A2H0W8K3_9BACT|nr:MAG: hypothetical protein COT75_03925 [Candidatus Beckwithbacteria bacterium CG10_big_fil_rev_8_21_14_0_10_34_10]